MGEGVAELEVLVTFVETIDVPLRRLIAHSHVEGWKKKMERNECEKCIEGNEIFQLPQWSPVTPDDNNTFISFQSIDNFTRATTCSLYSQLNKLFYCIFRTSPAAINRESPYLLIASRV